MDDLIVIILTLIIAVVGTIGQIKKKKQSQPQPEGEQQNTSDSFWDVLEDFGVQTQKPETQMAEKEQIIVDERPTEQKQYTFNAENEGQNNVIKKASVKDEIKQSMKQEKKEKTSETFSLRKAVVYSEILNRKYT